MNYPEAVAIVGGSIVTAVAVLVGLMKLRNGKTNGNGNGDPMRAFYDAIREQTGLLREIRDGLMSLRSDQRMASLEQSHLQKSVDALHVRLDPVVKGLGYVQE